jgi:hypothetical protein
MKILSKLVLKNVELAQIKGGSSYWVTGTRGQNGGSTFFDVGLFGGGGFGYESPSKQWCDVPDTTPGVFPTIGEECDGPIGYWNGYGGYEE